MSNHLGRGHAYNFIVPFERPLKLNDNSLGNQQSDFRYFSIYDSNQGGVNVCEVRGCHLRFDYGTS